ncbi:MAG: hypothetical protein Gaeavirus14_11 [Gaeavirus sp.]|uniref:Uncharacterized protein n=1 Tax=Gaeavirus sp. TaxID=2487767 RepID=A0A3G5A1W4_9VIRU|nr:MAG: hypothetical protein Gaeavirus14_11 [Gaeavirus sp.]
MTTPSLKFELGLEFKDLLYLDANPIMNSVTTLCINCGTSHYLQDHKLFLGSGITDDLTQYEFVKNIKHLIIYSDVREFVTVLDYFVNLQMIETYFPITKNMKFSDALMRIYVIYNFSLVDIEFPSRLYKLKLCSHYNHSLVGVKFPPELKVLELGNVDSLLDVILPERLEKIILSSNIKTLDMINDILFPPSLTTIDLSHIRPTTITTIPSNFTSIKLTLCQIQELSFQKLFKNL